MSKTEIKPRITASWEPIGEMPSLVEPDEYSMRPMQAMGYQELSDATHAVVNAPTASGKALLMCWLIANLLQKNPTKKAIITVPQTIIGSGFKGYFKLKLETHEDGAFDWSPMHYLFDGDKNSNIYRIKQFLSRQGNAKDINDRILVCSHSTIVSAYQQFPELLHNVVVCIDEAHHIHFSCTEDDNELFTDYHNQIGDLVRHCIVNEDSDINLLLSTATMFRGDRLSVIPEEHSDKFARFHYPMDEYLTDCYWLRSFDYNFVMYSHKWKEALEQIYNPGRKAIIYIPPVNSKRCSYGDKTIDVRKVYEAISNVEDPEIVEEPSGITLIKRSDGSWIKVVNLVDDSDLALRKKRKDLIHDAHNHVDNSMVDVVIALNMFKEGGNWKWAEDIMIIGNRGSLVDRQQIPGRGFRDAPNKEHLSVYEFIQFSFDQLDKESYREDVNNYIKVLFSTMLYEDAIYPIRVPIKNSGGAGSNDTAVRTSDYFTDQVHDHNKRVEILNDILEDCIRLQTNGTVDFGKNNEESQDKFYDVVSSVLNDNGVEEHHKEIGDYIYKKWMKESIGKVKGIDVSAIDFDIMSCGEVNPLSFILYYSEVCGLDTFKKFRDSFESSSALKKERLLKMARNGDDRPSGRKHELGAALGRYTNPRTASYDKEFDDEIRRLRPDWFVNQNELANEKKKSLLEMARNNEDRPSGRKHELGTALQRYTNPDHDCYDKEFDDEIRRLRPDWFVNQSELANEKKKSLLEMARRGDGRPNSKTHELGESLKSYTNPDSGCYDKEFDDEIRRLVPDWFYTNDEKWEKNFNTLLEYVKTKKQIPTVHSSIGRWAYNQKIRGGKISQDRRLKLESVPGWLNMGNKTWDERFDILLEYVKIKNQIPKKTGLFKGVQIARWVHEQRRKNKMGKMTNDRKLKLESVPGWSWSKKNKK